MKAIIITGTPGTGKSTLAKLISKKFGFKHIDVNKVVKDKKLSEGVDKKRKTKIVDVKKLNKELIKLIKESDEKMVIDSHMSHFLPKRFVGMCIVTICDIKELKKRLKGRKYPVLKINENIEAEIFQICYEEAKEKRHKIEVVDTSSSKELKLLLQKISLYNKK
ncbi:adenylate kinase family protein [Nanoarchaeota archaeon]